MDERVRELEKRLALAEETIARLSRAFSAVEQTDGHGITVTGPLRIANTKGQVGLELSTDTIDGGYIHLMTLDGDMRVTMGCDPNGGWLDIIHADSQRLVVTLTVTPEGGAIEVTDKEGNYVFDARAQTAE